MGPTGFERPPKIPRNSDNSQTGGAESGARGAPHRPSDPGLTVIVTTWPGLPDTMKAGILAMVRAVTETRRDCSQTTL